MAKRGAGTVLVAAVCMVASLFAATPAGAFDGAEPSADGLSGITLSADSTQLSHGQFTRLHVVGTYADGSTADMTSEATFHLQSGHFLLHGEGTDVVVLEARVLRYGWSDVTATVGGHSDTIRMYAHPGEGKIISVKAARSLSFTPVDTFSAKAVRALDGLPLPFQRIEFFIGGRQMCQAWTGSDGVARCSVSHPNLGAGAPPLLSRVTADMPEGNWPTWPATGWLVLDIPLLSLLL